MAEFPGAFFGQPDPPPSSRNEAITGSRVLKFLSLAIIFIASSDGVLCHEEGKRPTTSTASGTTVTGGLSTDLMVALGVGIVTLAAIILVSCCTKKRHNNQIQGDHSEPKFQLTASLRKKLDPVILHFEQTDESTMQAVKLFTKKVVIILHTCNKNEYWAAIERLQPPTTNDQSNIRDHPIIYPQVGSVIGWFAGYRAAVVMTGQGNKCRDELIKAFTESFPSGRVIIGAGIAYANNQKRKFADVLVSDQIENFVQYKKEGHEITCCGSREEIDPNVQRIFEDSARDWTDMKHFICADDNRTSVAHIGCIVSAPTLIRDEVLRDQLMKHTPNAIGGEMEGWVLLELKRTLKGQHKHIEVIVIKGVADYGDLAKGDKWQWTAAKAAMDCIHYCLDRSGGNEFRAIGDVPVTAVEPLQPTATLPPNPPECVAKYAQYLKDKYKRMSTLPDGDWPPSLGRQYTRLAMIEQERELPDAELVATMERDYIHGNIDNIVKRKKAVQLPEIFLPTEDGDQQLKILMDGAPGVGKSTLSRKICKDWASGKLLQQYHLVLLLPLRQASIREATSVEDLIEADNPDLKQQIVHHIQQTSGEHVLLILDGYDELSIVDRTQKSLFLDIVRGNKFLKCSVLVTSRPYASDYLQQLESVNRHVEVLGFTNEQIEHCITDNIPDKTKATELVQMLKERQDIASLCYIPLNCAIVLHVYEMAQCTLPHTLTKLYETFILNALKRHAKVIGNDPRSNRRLNTLKNLPEPLQQQLSALSTLAYNGLVADKMVFSTDDLEAVFPDCSDLNIECSLLGLMTAFKEFTSTDEELSYQFLHLTIQEFLAARWAASQLSADELLKFFQEHQREERYRMVLLFLAGISELSFTFADHLFRGELDFEESAYARMKRVKYFLFLCHLIYESQNLSLFHNLGSAIVGAKLSAAWQSMSPFDCLVLAHFLAWCDCSLKLLDLRYCGLTSQSLEVMQRVNLEHHGTTQIEEVDLGYNHKLIAKLSLLSKLPIFEHTQVLIARGLQHPEHCQVSSDVLDLLNMRHLTTLEISVKKNPDSNSVIYLSLNKFQCQHGNIDHQNAVHIFSSLELNTSLKELDLTENRQLAELDSEAVGCAIERMLNVNRTLKVLNLTDCGLINELASYFANGLAQNHSVRKVILHSNNIGSTGAVSILRSLEHNITLEELDLSENSQLAEGDSEAVGCAIEGMLNVNRTLTVLNLSGCQVTDAIVEHILTGLTKNTSLVTLDIGSPKLSGSCAVSFFQQMTTHPTVRITVGVVNVLGVGRVKMDRGSLWCVMCDLIPENCVEFFRALNNSGMKVSKLNVQDLTDQTAKHFAVGLAESQSVQALKSKHCNISSAGAVSIFTSLEHNTSLEELDLSESWRLAEGDSEAVGCAIERMLKVNRTMKILNLNLTNEVASYFANELAQNHSVRKVILHLNNIGSTGAVSIFRSLERNTSLEELDLSCNGHLVEGNSEAVGCAIERMLNANRTLKVLSLTKCGFTSEVASCFANGLAQNKSLRKVILQLNNIGTAGAVSIFRSLEHNTTSLEGLDLSENSQLAEGDSEAVGCAIERMLKVNRTLKVLNLSDCGLKTTVITHTAAGLVHNASLVELNIGGGILNGNDITSEWWVHLFKVLCKNTSLKKLDISHNKLGMEESVALAEMLSCNKSLTELNLLGCNIPEAGLRQIARGLLQNTTLNTLNLWPPEKAFLEAEIERLKWKLHTPELEQT